MAKKYQKPEPTGRGYVDAAILLLRELKSESLRNHPNTYHIREKLDSLYKMIE